jgi:hypothetical protein
VKQASYFPCDFKSFGLLTVSLKRWITLIDTKSFEPLSKPQRTKN